MDISFSFSGYSHYATEPPSKALELFLGEIEVLISSPSSTSIDVPIKGLSFAFDNAGEIKEAPKDVNISIIGLGIKMASTDVSIRFRNTPPSAFTRKPIVLTPTLPSPLRTFYIDAIAGLDSNSGSISSPFKTLSKLNTFAVAGDRFYLKGIFSSGITDRIGPVNNAGTATNPIQILPWPGFTATLSGGGTSDAYPAIFGNANLRYWIFKDLTLAPPNGMRAYSGGVASNVTFIGCTFIPTGGPSGAALLLQNPDFSFYDCTFTGTFGNLAANSGDVIFCMDGSHRCKLVRCTFDVNSYHVCLTLGGYQNSGNAGSNSAWVFDCSIRNPVAGGININGRGNNTIIEHSRFYDIATTSSVPSRTAIAVSAPDCIIRYNTAWNLGREFIKSQAYTSFGVIQTPNNSHFHNNTAFNVKGMAINLAVSNSLDPNLYHTNLLFEHNLVWKCGQSTINTGVAGEEFGFFNGVFYPIWHNCFGTSIGYAAGTIGGTIFRNNCFSRSAPSNPDLFLLGVRLFDTSNIPYTLTQVQSTFAGCENNIQKTDPIFVSESDPPNLRLQATSPMIDAGYTLSGISYLGSAPDIGTYEFGGNE